MINIALSKKKWVWTENKYFNTSRTNKFINYDELLKIRQNLYNEWLDEYETTALTKF